MNKKLIFYVSSEGSDNNYGTIHRPFKTIAKAVNAVKENNEYKSAVIMFFKGTYYLDETIMLTDKYFGENGKSLTIKPYNNERVTLSGGCRINTDWEYYRDGIYKCSLRRQRAEIGFDQLFADGRRQIRARYPNGDPTSPFISNYTFIDGADKRESLSDDPFSGTPPHPHREVYYDPRLFTDKTWSNPEDGIIHIFPEVNWNALQFEIKGIDYDRCAILFGHGGHQQHERFAVRPGTNLGKTSRYYIENIFEELDVPGEWYYDRVEMILYYMPYDDMNIDDVLFEVPMLERIISIQGSMASPAANIKIEGIRFAHTKTTYLNPYIIPSFGDWGIAETGAFFAEGAVNIELENCFFDAVGSNAVYLSKYIRDAVIKDCLITECGESGIAMVGKTMMTRDKSYECKYCGNVHPWGFEAHTEEYVGNCLIENNLIHDVGIFGKQTAGLFMAVSAKNTIRSNEMYNIPRAAICIHDGTYGGHLMEKNYLHHSCRDTDEHGTFNSWGRDSRWCHAQSHHGISHPAGDVKKDAKYQNVMRQNLFYDFKGWGIDLDDGSSNYDIYNNICIGVGIKNREGDFRKVHNNIVYKPTLVKPTAIQVGCENNNDEWYNNIIYAREDCIHMTLPPKSEPWVKLCDYNCYYSESGVFKSRGMDMNDWQSHGMDTNSIIADPLFSDADAWDFTVSDDSPALTVGFKNFPMDQFGLKDFPETWLDLEHKLPVYDMVTMDRDMLKELRMGDKPIRAKKDGAYDLTFNNGMSQNGLTVDDRNKSIEGWNNENNSAKWLLRYFKGGVYSINIEYSLIGKGEASLSSFVESIGSNDADFILKDTDGLILKQTAGVISLSGEDTDNIVITLTLKSGTDFNLHSIDLIPQG